MLLDTCTLLWLVGDQDRISKRGLELIAARVGHLHVSAISAFEIGVKCRKGKLTLPMSVDRWYAKALELHGLREIPMDGGIAVLATTLPPLHGDPADRIIVATAQARGLTVLTPDPLVRAYPDTASDW